MIYAHGCISSNEQFTTTPKVVNGFHPDSKPHISPVKLNKISKSKLKPEGDTISCLTDGISQVLNLKPSQKKSTVLIWGFFGYESSLNEESIYYKVKVPIIFILLVFLMMGQLIKPCKLKHLISKYEKIYTNSFHRAESVMEDAGDGIVYKAREYWTFLFTWDVKNIQQDIQNYQ